MRSERRIIYDSEHIRVVHKPAVSSPYALITFSHAAQFVNGSWFWGDGIVEKVGLAAVGVVARSNNWFPLREMQRASEAIKSALSGHENIIGYGTSMGGYGALKHGKLLGMSHALAFVPQWSIDPHDVNLWDPRFVQHFDPSVHSAVAISSGDIADTAVIFYDPFMKLDRLSFEKILIASPHCIGIKSHFTGHSSVETFKGTSRMTELFRLLLDGEFAAMRRRAREVRRDKQSAIRPLTLAQLNQSRNAALATQIMRIHAEKMTARQKATFYNDLACLLCAKGKFSEARQHALEATTGFIDSSFQMRLSMIEQKLGNEEAALTIARDMVGIWPNNVRVHLHLSSLLEPTDRNGAIAAARAALSLAPSNAEALQRLANLTQGNEHLEYVSKLYRIRPDFRSHILLGEAWEKQRRFSEAREAYEAAAAIKPAEALPYQKIASMDVRAKKWSVAADVSRRALALAPTNAACYVLLAQALRGGGLYREALDEVRKALEFSPTNQVALSMNKELRGRLSATS